MRTTISAREGRLRPLFVHLRLHYQLLFLSPLFAWGFVLGGNEFSLRALLGFVAFHVFLYGGITAYNSYYDRDEGPVGGLWAPPRVSPELLPFSLAVQCIGLALALFVGWWFAALYCVVMALSVAYSHPSLRWKARPILSLVVVAFGQGSVGFLAGWLCGHAIPTAFDVQASLALSGATLMTVGFYPLTQLYQIEEDRRRGDRTFSVAYGAPASFRFALACLALGGCFMVPLVALRFGPVDAAAIGLFYLALLVGVSRWHARFQRTLERNFVVLHGMQSAVSVGTLAYIVLRPLV